MLVRCGVLSSAQHEKAIHFYSDTQWNRPFFQDSFISADWATSRFPPLTTVSIVQVKNRRFKKLKSLLFTRNSNGRMNGFAPRSDTRLVCNQVLKEFNQYLLNCD